MAGNALGRTGYIPPARTTPAISRSLRRRGRSTGPFDANELNGNGPGGLDGFRRLPDTTHPYGDGVLDTGEVSATTAADGSYKLTGLPPGVTYYIREVLQSNWQEVSPARPWKLL